MIVCALLRKRAVALQALCTVFLLSALANAYPELFIENGFSNGCTDHPRKGYARHGKPVADRSATFTVAAAGSSAAVTAVCPGGQYTVTVGYGSSRRRTLLTASAGSLAAATYPSCPGRSYSESSSTTYEDTLSVPCTATGSIDLVVTSASGSSSPFYDASTTLTVKPLAQCPSSSCSAAPTAAAAATAPATAATAPAAAGSPADVVTRNTTPAAAPAAVAAAAPAASYAATPTEPAAPAVARSTGSSSSSSACDGSSAFGYACQLPAGGGAVLHYTQGGTAPDNACTRAVVGGVTNIVTPTESNKPVHFLLESPLGGYAGLSFPQRKGHMVPADAVIGYVDAGTAQPVVTAYHMTDYQVDKSASNFAGLGWADKLGAATVNGKTVVCFSRMSEAPTAAVVKSLNLNGVDLNWAADASTSFVTHSLQGSLTVDMETGAAAVSSSSRGDNLTAMLAHGALMLAAFIGLMPLGALMARHKWVYGNKQHGGIKGTWFALHRGVQALALLAALAGFVLALVVVDQPWEPGAPRPHSLFDLHRVMGVVVMGLAVMQATAGFARPTLTARHRPWWRAGHLGLGYLTLAAGIVVCFVGAVLLHDLLAQPWLPWLLPMGLLLGLLLLAALLAEVAKVKLQRTGWYHAPSHSFGDPSANPYKQSPQVPTSIVV